MRFPAAWRAPALGGLSGALYFLAFPPHSRHVLGWVALVPLLVAVRHAPRGRTAVLAGAAAAMVACAGGYAWIGGMAHRFWDVPWVFAALLQVLYGTFGELHFTVFAALAWLLRRRLRAAPAAATAALFVACELVVPRVFPDKLGHTQIDVGSLPYAAALVGAQGLSFALAWTAACVAALLVARRGTRRAPLAEFALCAAAVAGLSVWGGARRRALDASPVERRLDVVLVQSNLGDPEELATSLGSVTQAIDSTVALYAELTRGALQGHPPDLVVWPETAVPSVPRPRVLQKLQRLVAEVGAPLLFGAYDSERIDGNRWRLYNAAFLMTGDGALSDRYAKHKLLLFGEYVPLSERFPVLLNLLPTPGEFTPGPGPRVFRVPARMGEVGRPAAGGDVALAPLICYELLFPRVVRGALRAGGEVIVNLTNDYWFGRRLEPAQHLALCRMCALETGRPIVRATNTGISALVDHRGAVVARTGVWTEEILRGQLPVPPHSWTPYARWGEAALAVLVAACWLAALLLARIVPPGTMRPGMASGPGMPAPRSAVLPGARARKGAKRS